MLPGQRVLAQHSARGPEQLGQRVLALLKETAVGLAERAGARRPGVPYPLVPHRLRKDRQAGLKVAVGDRRKGLAHNVQAFPSRKSCWSESPNPTMQCGMLNYPFQSALHNSNSPDPRYRVA